MRAPKAEEILREIDLAVGGARQVREIQCRNAEQCPRAFCVGGGDDRRIDPEEPVSSKNRWIAAARLWRTRVAAPITFVRGRRCATSRKYSNVCGFGLDRIGVRVFDPADHVDRTRLHLEGLPLGQGRHDHPRDLYHVPVRGI
jgi:hypothetical protein